MLLTVKVYPRSKKNRLEWEQGQLKVHLTAPPVEGAANEALIALLAEQLDLPKRAISIMRGATSRQKTVEISGLTLEEVRAKIVKPPRFES
jgi:uncharacterized protein